MSNFSLLGVNQYFCYNKQNFAKNSDWRLQVMSDKLMITEKQNGLIIKIAMLACISSLTACDSIPKDNTQLPPVQLTFEPAQPFQTVDKLTTSNNNSPSIADKRWQSFYSDPKLKQLIQLGLQNNKDLQNALLAIEEAKAQYQISETLNKPKLVSNAQFSRSANRTLHQKAQNNYSVGLAMPSYELDLWGKVSSLKKQALHNYLGTKTGKDNAQIALISNIAQTYVHLSYAKAQYQLAKATVKSREHSLQIMEKRFQVGVDAKTPSLQAKSLLEGAKISMYNAETSVKKLRNALQILIGMPVPKQLEPQAGITKITNQQVFNTGLPSELLFYRPDIVQAEHQLQSAGANIKVARSAYFPSISLTGRLGLSSFQLKDLFSSSSLGWSFAPSISLPIFDGGQRNANYQVAEIKQKQALVNYEKRIQTAFKEVADVLAERATLQKRLQAQNKLQANFNETYNITNARFKAGLSNYLGVLDAERSKFSAQQNILQLQQANLISQIQLYQVLGGGVSMEQAIEKAPMPTDNKIKIGEKIVDKLQKTLPARIKK